MANILFVVAPKNFRDKEYFIPKKMLEDSGHSVQTASTIIGEITGVDGQEASSNLHIGEVNVLGFDGVGFIGGPGMSELVNDMEIKRLAQDFFSSGKLVSAICVATAVLAKAYLIKGKKVTGWAGVENDIKEAGAIYTGERVEQDQNIITASGPESAEAFANKIIEYFQTGS